MRSISKNRSNVTQLQLIKCEGLLQCTNKLHQLSLHVFLSVLSVRSIAFNSEYLTAAPVNNKYGHLLPVPIFSLGVPHCFHIIQPPVSKLMQSYTY